MRAAFFVLLALWLALGTAEAQAPQDTVRVIVPTEGGVLYYRAGPGRGVVFRKAVRDSVAKAEAEAATALAVLEAVTEARAALAGDPAAVARLDAVEQAARRTAARTRDRADRLAERREERERIAQLDPVARPSDPARLAAEAERPRLPVVAPVPVPGDPVVPAPVDPADPAADPVIVQLPPVVTVEEVERAFLDTGLFRASRVPFGFGQATLLPEAERVLDAVGQALVRAPSLRVTVDGHTDAISSDAFNLGLSERRAASVREHLIGRFGIEPSRLVARGFGELQPIATNETETGRALNRRVEFVVIGGAPLVPVE
ncbi:MAG: OmpA family protein [Bacteroidota bacterium]